MRSSVTARLHRCSTLILAALFACAIAAPVAFAETNPVRLESGAELPSVFEGSIEGASGAAFSPSDQPVTNRTYVLPADTLSSFSVATVVTGTVELAGAADEGRVIPTISTTYVAEGCVYSFDEETSELTLVNAANASLDENGVLVVPSAVELDGKTHSVTGISAGAFCGIDAAVVALSRNVTFIDEDAFKGAPKLQGVHVSSSNVAYSSYDGCLYDQPLSSLLLIPEGRVGAVRIASGAEADPEAFSHCASAGPVLVDAGSAASLSLADVELHDMDGDAIEVIVVNGDRDDVAAIGGSAEEAGDLSVPSTDDESDGYARDSAIGDGAGDSNSDRVLIDPVIFDSASEAVDELVQSVAVPSRETAEVLSSGDVSAEGTETPIYTDVVPLAVSDGAARSDNSIFHMELLPDGNGFMLDYIDSTASGAITIPALWTQDGVTLPVTMIDSWAFCEGGYREGPQADQVTSIHIPATVTNIGGSYPFGWNGTRQLASITVDTGNSVYASKDGVLFTKDMTALIFYPVKKPDTEYRIPSGVKGVYNAAFTRCYNLQSVVIPASLSQNLGGWTLLDACTNVRDIYVLDATNPAMTAGFCIYVDRELITVHLVVYASDQVQIWNNAGFPLENIVPGEPQFSFSLDSSGTGFILTAASSLLVGDIGIPGTWTQDGMTLPVVGIGEYAFSGGSIEGTHATAVTSIHIPASVTSISPYHPFGWNNSMSLAAVTVEPDNANYASIDGVLYDKGVTRLIFYPFAKADESYAIPSTVSSYQLASMTRCRYLKSVTVNASFMASMGATLMDACETLRDIYVDGITPPSMGGSWYIFADKAAVTVHLLNYTNEEIQIWVNAGFKMENIVPLGSKLTFHENADGTGFVLAGIDSSAEGDVVIPSQWSQGGRTLPVVAIGSYALCNGSNPLPDAVNVTSIQIPATVSWISPDYAFGWKGGRKLHEVKVDRENPVFCSIDGVLFTKDRTRLVFYPPAKSDQVYSIPAGTLHIGHQSFVRCSYLQSVVFPASCTANLSGDGVFDANPFLSDMYVEGVTAPTLGPGIVNNSDKSKYTIHLANYTPDEVQLWVNAGFSIERIVPSAGTAAFPVTFDVVGGSPQPYDQTILRDGHVREPEEPIRLGYDFTGWYSFKRDKIWDFANDTIDADMTLIAVWEPHVVTLRLYIGEHAEFADAEEMPDVGSDESGRYVEFSIPYGQTFALPLLNRAGHRIVAWCDEGGDAVLDVNGEILANGGSVRDLSTEDGAFFAYTADWRAVYNVDVPVRVDLSVGADFVHGKIEVSPAFADSAVGTFENYSEGPIEVVVIADEADGSSAKNLFPDDGHERAFLTLSPENEESTISVPLGKGAVVEKDDEGWNWSLVIPSGTAADGFIEGVAESVVPGRLKVVYGIDVTTLQPQDMALVADGTELTRLVYTVRFAEAQ